MSEHLCALPQSRLPGDGQGSFLGWIKYPSLSWVHSESSILNLKVRKVRLNCIEIRLRVTGLALLHVQLSVGLGPVGL